MPNMKNIINAHNKKLINHATILLQEHATVQESTNVDLTKNV